MKKFIGIVFIACLNGKLFSQFSIYNTANSGLTDDFCWFVTHHGSDIWVGTYKGGANRFNGNSWINYTTGNSGIAADYVTPIIFETNGDTWFGTYQSNGGLSKRSGQTFNTYNTSNSQIPDNDIVAIAIDAGNNKWIGTRHQGLAKFDGTNWTIYNTTNSPLPSNVIYSLEIDALGQIWVGTALGGLARLSGSSWTLYNTGNVLPDNDIYALKYNTATGCLWVGTAGGVVVYNGFGWITYTSSNSGLASNYVRGFAFSASAETFIATGYAGISRFNGSSWQTYNMGNSNLPVNAIWSLRMRNNGGSEELWASTWGGGVVKLNVQTTPTGDPEIGFENFSVFPNPARRELNINSKSFNESFTFILHNALGENVMEKTCGASDIHTIDLSGLTAGIFYYTLKSANHQQTGKILVEP